MGPALPGRRRVGLSVALVRSSQPTASGLAEPMQKGSNSGATRRPAAGTRFRPAASVALRGRVLQRPSASTPLGPAPHPLGRAGLAPVTASNPQLDPTRVRPRKPARQVAQRQAEAPGPRHDRPASEASALPRPTRRFCPPRSPCLSYVFLADREAKADRRSLHRRRPGPSFLPESFRRWRASSEAVVPTRGLSPGWPVAWRSFARLFRFRPTIRMPRRGVPGRDRG